MLDANVLIDANRDFYPLKRVPEFWKWLEYVGNEGLVKIPLEIYDEIKDGKDDLAKWAKTEEIKIALLFGEESEVSIVSVVTEKGYAPDLADDEVEQIGRDPFLIAYALTKKSERCVVTTERSKPKRQRENRHVPDVCNDFEVMWCDTFEWLRALDFSTDWNKR